MTGQPLDLLPISGMYILTVVVLLMVMEVGYQLAKAMQRRGPAKGDAGFGTIVGATLALLAFLLAFVVSFAVNIFNERRVLVIKEANAIGTAYLRAGFLDEPYSTESRDLLREYVDTRVAALDLAKREIALDRSVEIHDELWQRAEVIAREISSETISLYISAVNEVIDVHTERFSIGVGIRVPPTVLLGLYLVAMFTMFLIGMQSGYAENRNLIALFVLVLIVSVVFLLIVDLDRAQEGLLQVPQQPLFDLQQQLKP